MGPIRFSGTGWFRLPGTDPVGLSARTGKGGLGLSGSTGNGGLWLSGSRRTALSVPPGAVLYEPGSSRLLPAPGGIPGRRGLRRRGSPGGAATAERGGLPGGVLPHCPSLGQFSHPTAPLPHYKPVLPPHSPTAPLRGSSPAPLPSCPSLSATRVPTVEPRCHASCYGARAGYQQLREKAAGGVPSCTPNPCELSVMHPKRDFPSPRHTTSLSPGRGWVKTLPAAAASVR